MEQENLVIELLNVLRYKDEPKKKHSQSLIFSALSFRLDSDSIFKYGEKTLHAKTNDISFVPQNLYYERTSTKEDLIVFHFNIIGRSADSIMVFTPPDPDKYKKLFCDALKVWRNKSVGYRHKATSILYDIFFELQKDNTSIFTKTDSDIQIVINEIEKNFPNPDFKVESLSKKIYISQAYLRRKFNAQFGLSPKAYLTKRRLDEAELMLKSKLYTQKEIAQKCGFSDVKYFRFAFKKNTGKTLSQYKRSF